MTLTLWNPAIIAMSCCLFFESKKIYLNRDVKMSVRKKYLISQYLLELQAGKRHKTSLSGAT